MLSLTPPVPPPTFPSLTSSNLSPYPYFQVDNLFFTYICYICVYMCSVCVYKNI